MEPNSEPSSSVSKGEAKEIGQPLGLKTTYLTDRLHKIQEVLKRGMLRPRKFLKLTRSYINRKDCWGKETLQPVQPTLPASQEESSRVPVFIIVT